MIGGASITLIDTAGIRTTDDAVEAEGVRRSLERIAAAGVVILVVDGSEPHHPDNSRLFDIACNGSPMVVISKGDLPLRIDPGVYCSQRPDIATFTLSVVTGEGFPDFSSALASRCRTASQSAGAAVTVPCIRHRVALESAAGHLESAVSHAGSGEGFLDQMALELHAAVTSLGEITGQSATEEILERIFSRFCVGK